MLFSSFTNPVSGLSNQQVDKILKRDGFNESPNQKARTIFSLLKELITEPMILLLLVGSLVYFLIGEPRDALVLSFMILVIVVITIIQERKTEKALEALKGISNPKAFVIRNGKQIQILTREIVAGDIIILREGDRVAADSFVIDSTNISVNESLLTGESVPVNKIAYSGEDISVVPGGQNRTMVYGGTLIVAGHGKAQVTATGPRSEIGKIGKSLLTIVEENTNLQKEIKRLVKFFAIIAFIICAIIVVGFGLFQNQWLNGVLSGITISMTLLPEEFPVVLTIFMTLGALRMSAKQVLSRNTKVIETLGAASVLCVDKTGTLTENQMSLRQLNLENEMFTFSKDNKYISKKVKMALKIAKMASQQSGFDPIEKAILNRTKDEILDKWQIIKEYPFSAKLMAAIYVWKKDTQYLVAAKGAPEHILEICKISKIKKSFWLAKVTQMASQGQRVLALAQAIPTNKVLSANAKDYNYEFLGLLGFIDPVKPDVESAVNQCHLAGVRVVMITGDYPATACYVGRTIGIKSPDMYLTGEDLDHLTRRELLKKIKQTNIFCRIIPNQKLRIVQLLKSAGNIVAMTGDGINDAPALKAAHIGIAMGKRGTDVAKEASDLIILDDNFVTIVGAIRMGRRIYNNIKKALAYVVSMHIPISGLALLPVILGIPPILLPIHVAFLELIIDPACTTIFESEKENDQVMKNLPRALHDALFNKRTIIFSLLQGLGLLIAVLITFFISSNIYHLSELESRTAVFVTLVLGNLSLITTNRSWHKTVSQLFKSPNKAYWIVIGITYSWLTLAVSQGEIREFFHFAKIPISLLIVAYALGIFSIFWFELRKIIIRKYPNAFFR